MQQARNAAEKIPHTFQCSVTSLMVGPTPRFEYKADSGGTSFGGGSSSKCVLDLLGVPTSMLLGIPTSAGIIGQGLSLGIACLLRGAVLSPAPDPPLLSVPLPELLQ